MKDWEVLRAALPLVAPGGLRDGDPAVAAAFRTIEWGERTAAAIHALQMCAPDDTPDSLIDRIECLDREKRSAVQEGDKAAEDSLNRRMQELHDRLRVVATALSRLEAVGLQYDWRRHRVTIPTEGAGRRPSIFRELVRALLDALTAEKEPRVEKEPRGWNTGPNRKVIAHLLAPYFAAEDLRTDTKRPIDEALRWWSPTPATEPTPPPAIST